MTINLKSGVTHDIVLHLHTAQEVGVMVVPGTYRVSKPPPMIPRLAVGDPRGLDYSRWRSFVQDNFSGGQGQYLWSKDAGNDRYAESVLIDLGVYPQLTGERVGLRDVIGAPELKDLATAGAAFATALTPIVTTVDTPLPTLYTAAYPAYTAMFSNAVHMLHNRMHIVYTNVEGRLHALTSSLHGHASPGGVIIISRPGSADLNNIRNRRGNPLVNQWAVVATTEQLPTLIHNITLYSNGIYAAFGTLGLKAYISTDGTMPATWHTPIFSTNAQLVTTFDRKLWRADHNKIAVLEPTGSTLPTWSNYYEAGDASHSILNATPFSGRLMLCKEDSLWTWEGGRVYELQNFKDQADASNFSLLTVGRNDLYFNIQQRIYRMTPSLTLEIIPFPGFTGTVLGGVAQDEELFVLTTGRGQGTRLWIYNFETGGVREWFRSGELSHRRITPVDADIDGPTSINSEGGLLWLSPMYLRAVSNTRSPITAVNKLVNVYEQDAAFFFKTDLVAYTDLDYARAYLITSLLDFGYPATDKLFNKVSVRYDLFGKLDKILVYYHLRPTPTAVSAFLDAADFETSFVTTETSGVWNDGLYGSGDPAHEIDLPIFYIGFNTPVKGVQFQIRNSNQGAGAASYYVDYWNGTEWKGVNETRFPEISPPPQYTNLAGTGQRAPRVLLQSEHHGWSIPRDWAARSLNGLTAYFIRYALTSPAGQNLDLVEVIADAAPELAVPATLEKWNWRLLGTITSADGYQELTFPDETISKTMMLKFELESPFGTTRPEVTRYEIEWMPVGPNPNLLNISAVVVAANAIETLRGPGSVVENSATYIARSLFSMIGAGKPYVIQLPWPPPVGHTRRMKVHLGEAGARPAQLAYTNTIGADGAAIGADIPIMLEEI